MTWCTVYARDVEIVSIICNCFFFVYNSFFFYLSMSLTECTLKLQFEVKRFLAYEHRSRWIFYFFPNDSRIEYNINWMNDDHYLYQILVFACLIKRGDVFFFQKWKVCKTISAQLSVAITRDLCLVSDISNSFKWFLMEFPEYDAFVHLNFYSARLWILNIKWTNKLQRCAQLSDNCRGKRWLCTFSQRKKCFNILYIFIMAKMNRPIFTFDTNLTSFKVVICRMKHA